MYVYSIACVYLYKYTIFEQQVNNFNKNKNNKPHHFFVLQQSQLNKTQTERATKQILLLKILL